MTILSTKDHVYNSHEAGSNEVGKLKAVVPGFSGLEILTHKLAVIPGYLKQEWAPSLVRGAEWQAPDPHHTAGFLVKGDTTLGARQQQ